jgi:aspartate aminotransferase-like enzyme
MSDHVRLYIPGPVEVSDASFAAMATPMIGHRSKEFQELYGGMQPRLQQLFETQQPVFLSTSSAWGVMEGAIRNLVAKKVLCCCAGAFSDKWIDVARRCGKQAEALQYEWGQPIDPIDVRAKLETGEFDVVTLVHNETSTGVMSPLAEIAAVVNDFDDVLLVTDTVSSFSVVPTPVDELGIDVLLTGSQKALALPPGLALFSASEAAFARAETIHDRGYYFDFIEFRKNQQKDMTPSTPSIALINALAQKLEEIFTEGVSERHQRHARLNSKVHAWVETNGFEFFAPEGFRSKSLTCVKNNREIDLPALISLLRENHSLIIDGGYGKIKGQTFRISNMGNETDESIDGVLAALDDSLAKLS